MNSIPPINLVSMVHLILLCLWGGVVATETVLELYPYRRRELHPYAIRFHYWIDLLVEAPLILGVLVTGATLIALAWPLTGVQSVKVACALVAVSMNVLCIVLVIQRKRRLDGQAAEPDAWSITRRIVRCAMVGLPFAAVAAGLGFWLAQQRMAQLLG